MGAAAGTAYDSAYQVVKQIKAPSRFEGDHLLMVQTLEELVGHDADIKSAAENEDFRGMQLAVGFLVLGGNGIPQA